VLIEFGALMEWVGRSGKDAKRGEDRERSAKDVLDGEKVGAKNQRVKEQTVKKQS
jgi:hypothetical protein